MQNNTFSTLFLGQNFIKLARVDSTNNFLKELLSNSEPLAEGTVIMAEDQFAGRGQQQTSWQSEPGKNLTFSFYLRPSFLPVSHHFYLNVIVCLGIINAVNKEFGTRLCVKWPNDIYHGDKKLGGVLIENIVSGSAFRQSVVGVGLNINQQELDPLIQNRATSLFQILHNDVDIYGILTEICSEVEGLYLLLRAGNYTVLLQNYVKAMYRNGVLAAYRQNGETFEGRIDGVDGSGQLVIVVNDQRRMYNFKEIEFIIS